MLYAFEIVPMLQNPNSCATKTYSFELGRNEEITSKPGPSRHPSRIHVPLSVFPMSFTHAYTRKLPDQHSRQKQIEHNISRTMWIIVRENASHACRRVRMILLFMRSSSHRIRRPHSTLIQKLHVWRSRLESLERRDGLYMKYP